MSVDASFDILKFTGIPSAEEQVCLSKQVVVFLGFLRCFLPGDDDRLRRYFLLDPDSEEASQILDSHLHLFDCGDIQPVLRVAGPVFQLVGKTPLLAPDVLARMMEWSGVGPTDACGV